MAKALRIILPIIAAALFIGALVAAFLPEIVGKLTLSGQLAVIGIGLCLAGLGCALLTKEAKGTLLFPIALVVCVALFALAGIIRFFPGELQDKVGYSSIQWIVVGGLGLGAIAYAMTSWMNYKKA